MRNNFILICTIAMIALMTSCEGQPEHNKLSQQEINDGWELLFDGTTLNGWRDYNGETLTAPWFAEDGMIQAKGEGADEHGYIAYENHTVVLNDKPYPVPLLNMYAQDHYTNAKNLGGDTYSNFHASLNGLVTYETVVRNAGHLNFTDLPLFSPLLAKKLGVGTIDPWYCIETMNATVLEFFNSFLKDRGLPDIAKEQ